MEFEKKIKKMHLFAAYTQQEPGFYGNSKLNGNRGILEIAEMSVIRTLRIIFAYV